MSNNRKVYSFASVGQTQQEVISNNTVVASNPIGFSTPVRLGSSDGGTFSMHTDLLKQIRDNFRNMVATNHGDRLMLRDFGANLRPLVFELGNERIDEVAINNIATTTRKYMPFVSLETFETENLGNDGFGNATVKVRVAFSVPSLNSSRQMVELLIRAGG
jgi:phage baseplate assembly protein W